MTSALDLTNINLTGAYGVNADDQFLRPNVTAFHRKMPTKIKLLTNMEQFDAQNIDGAYKAKTMNASFWNKHHERSIARDGIDMSHALLGTHPLGLHTEEIHCGRKWVLSQDVPVHYKDCGPFKYHTLLLQPASAANAATIVDRNVIAATESINQFFPLIDPKTKVVLGADARAQVTRLAGRNYELTRIMWRLGVLYVAKALGEKLNATVASVATLSDVDVVDIRDASGWAPTLAMRGFNWISYRSNLDSLQGPDDALSVLTLAAADNPGLVFSNGVPTPSILATYPPIVTPRVLFFSGRGGLARDKFNALSAAQVWDIAVDYALQNGDVSELLEAVDAITGMLYAPHQHSIAPFYSSIVHLGLPRAEMEACVLLPLSTKSLMYGESSVFVEAPKFKEMVYNNTSLSMVVALAVKQVAYVAGFGFTFYRSHITVREKAAMVHSVRGVTPIMAAAERILNAIGYDGTLGRVLLHASLNPRTIESIFEWYDDDKALLWEEALPLIERVPYNCSLLGKLKPMAVLTDNVAIDHWYGVGIVPQAMSTVDALNSLMCIPGLEMGWQVELPSHNQVRWHDGQRILMANGRASDWGHCERAVIDDFVVSSVFKFKTVNAVTAARVVNSICGALEWFVIQADERPAAVMAAPTSMYGPTIWPSYGKGPPPKSPPGGGPPPSPPRSPPKGGSGGGGGSPPLQPPPKSPPHPKKPSPPPSPPVSDEDDWFLEGAKESKTIDPDRTAPDALGGGTVGIRGNTAQAAVATAQLKSDTVDPLVKIPGKSKVVSMEHMEHTRNCDVLGLIMNTTEDTRVKSLAGTILKLWDKQANVQLPDEALTPDVAADMCQFIRDVNWTPTFWRIPSNKRYIVAHSLSRILGALVPQMKTPSLQAEFTRLQTNMLARAAAMNVNPALSSAEAQDVIERLAHDKHKAAVQAAKLERRPLPHYHGPPENIMSTLTEFDKLNQAERSTILEKLSTSGRTIMDFLTRAAPVKAHGKSNPDLMKKALELAEKGAREAEQEAFNQMVEFFVGMLDSDNDFEGTLDDRREGLMGALDVNVLPPALAASLEAWNVRALEAHGGVDKVADNWEAHAAAQGADVAAHIPPAISTHDSVVDDNADRMAADSGGVTITAAQQQVLDIARQMGGVDIPTPQIAGADARAQDFGDIGSGSGRSQSAQQQEQQMPIAGGSPPTTTSAPSGGTTQTTSSSTGGGNTPAPTLDFRLA